MKMFLTNCCSLIKRSDHNDSLLLQLFNMKVVTINFINRVLHHESELDAYLSGYQASIYSCCMVEKVVHQYTGKYLDIWKQGFESGHRSLLDVRSYFETDGKCQYDIFWQIIGPSYLDIPSEINQSQKTF